MKFIIILFFVGSALAQPVLDSIYVIDSTSAYFSQAVPLDDGGYILSGAQFEGRNSFWRVARMNAQREITWSRIFLSNPFFTMNEITVTDDAILVPGEITVPIDSNTSTSASMAVAYSLDGDSLWANPFEDSLNYVKFSSACAAPDGGFYILGVIGIIEGTRFNHQIRLLRVTSTGEVVWDRRYGGIDYDAGGTIVRLAGDSLLVTALAVRNNVYNVEFMWTNLDGDSLGATLFPLDDSAYIYYPHHLYRRSDGWDFLWLVDYGSNDNTDSTFWLRTDFSGEVQFQRMLSAPTNSMQNFAPANDDFLTTGYSPFGTQNRNVVSGRANVAGYWYYNDPVDLPFSQEGYGFVPNDDEIIEVIGRSATSDSTGGNPCIFYLGGGGFSSYLYPIPALLEFGVVELDSAATRELGLSITWDSSVTITDFAVPDWAALSLDVPVTIQAGETLHCQAVFRPNALTQFTDTIHIFSDARNQDLGIPIHGAAPYPECRPSLATVNFFWTFVGDSVRRPLSIRNTGTVPLHIDPIAEPVPFFLDSTGPFVVPADSYAVLWFEFWPDSGIDYERLMILNSDDPGGPDTVRLLGRGIAQEVDANDRPELPTEFAVYPAYPNPFNATVSIRFDLPVTETVELVLFDLQGRRVKSVLSEVLNAGSRVVHIDGESLASGIYFARISTEAEHVVQKLLLVR